MKKILFLTVALMAAVLVAAPAKSSFQKPPSAAAKALKATIGKPFEKGFVFIDGKYIMPPYTVARYGTVIRINDIQVTDEIIPWNEFLKTQEGATVTRSESAPEESLDEPEEEEEDFDDFDFGDDEESSLDDLFDDEPAPKKEAKKPAKKKSKPKPKKPTVTVTVSFDGTFEPNDTTKGYVEKINKERLRIDKHLRSGGYYFFGSRSNSVSGDATAAKRLLEKLPEMLRDSPSAEVFTRNFYNAGFVQFSRALAAELYKNRSSYILLMERRKAFEEERKWSQILGK